MKLVISHSNTKRTIDGAFEICGNRHDLMSLIEQIAEKINGTNFVCGWVTIIDKPRILKNTEPKPWD